MASKNMTQFVSEMEGEPRGAIPTRTQNYYWMFSTEHSKPIKQLGTLGSFRQVKNCHAMSPTPIQKRRQINIAVSAQNFLSDRDSIRCLIKLWQRRTRLDYDLGCTLSHQDCRSNALIGGVVVALELHMGERGKLQFSRRLAKVANRHAEVPG